MANRLATLLAIKRYGIDDRNCPAMRAERLLNVKRIGASFST